MGRCAAVLQPVGTPERRGGARRGEPDPNQHAAAWRPAQRGVHVGRKHQQELNFANHCGDNQCGCDDEKGATRGGRGFILAAHPRQPPRLLFVFNDISFAVSPVDPGERSLLTVFCSHVRRHRRTFHSTKKENLTQTLENSLCETLVKLTQRRAAILKLA